MHYRFIRAAATSAFALLFARSGAAAGPVAAGPAFRLAVCPTCAQENPQIAGTASGKFAAAFDIKLTRTTPAVQARLFPATGAAPAPFRPQAAEVPAQYDAAVASNAAGALVVAWSTTDGLTRNSDVWAQRYDATAKPVGPVIPVSVDASGVRMLDTLPRVAMGADGAFTVTWLHVVPPGQPNPTGYQIWARRFAASGSPAGAPVALGTGLVEGVRPAACVDTSGKTIVVWATDDEISPFEPSRVGVSMRRLSAKGAPLGAAAVVALPRATSSHPAVSCGLASTFVVTWDTDQAPGAVPGNVVAQRYSAGATRVGPVFLASGPAGARQREPAIAHDAAGNFVIVWQNVGATSAGLYGQRYSAAGAALGAVFTVAPAESPFMPLSSPSIAAAGPANAFVVAWENPRLGLFARRFKIAK